MDTRVALTSIIGFSLTLAACGGGGGGNDSPSTDGNGGNQATQVQPTLTSIQNNIFTPICSSCHGGANPAAGQDLSSRSASIANLINVQSSHPDFLRVDPGNPEESYLYLKVTGDARAGDRMPLNDTPLIDQQIEAIRQWIADGAQTSSFNDPVTVAQTRVIKQGPTLTFDVTLTGSLDHNSINEHSVNIFANYEQYQVQLSQPSVSLRQDLTGFRASITLPSERANSIDMEFNHPNWSTVLSAEGNEIDGDKDGRPGGMYRYEYKFD